MAAVLTVAITLLTSISISVRAQQAAPGAPGRQPGEAAQPAGPGAATEATWATQCTAKTRLAALECSVQQSIVKTDTRQLIATFGIRIPPETRAPVMMIQLPLGLYVPAGVALHVDQGQAVALPIQTCDATGCYAGIPVAAEFLEQLRNGKTLRIRFENLAQSKVEVPLPLAGFASAYDAVR
jgi:invasion protein IalB